MNSQVLMNLWVYIDNYDERSHYLHCPVSAHVCPFESIVPFGYSSCLVDQHIGNFTIFYEMYNYVKHNISLSLYLLSYHFVHGKLVRDQAITFYNTIAVATCAKHKIGKVETDRHCFGY